MGVVSIEVKFAIKAFSMFVLVQTKSCTVDLAGTYIVMCLTKTITVVQLDEQHNKQPNKELSHTGLGMNDLGSQITYNVIMLLLKHWCN